jgi:hypothetical protein
MPAKAPIGRRLRLPYTHPAFYTLQNLVKSQPHLAFSLNRLATLPFMAPATLLQLDTRTQMVV